MLMIPVLLVGQSENNIVVYAGSQSWIELEPLEIDRTRLRSAATIEDDFADDTVLVVLTRQASRDFRVLTPCDFPEFAFSSVEELTPGFELAETQMEERSMSRMRSHSGDMVIEYEPEWSVDLDEFRRILSLRLEEPSKENVLEAISLLEGRADVFSAEPDMFDTIPLMATPTSWPQIPLDQWNLHSIIMYGTLGTTRGSRDIVVGVLDTGIDAHHPDLAGRVNLGLSRCFTGQGFPITDDPRINTNPITGEVRLGHGTQVASVISANGIGMMGMADVTLASLRVIRSDGNGVVSAQINAINFATQRRMQILNMSVGGTNNDSARLQAIRNFPGLVIASAGNTGGNNDSNGHFPSNHRLPNLISVGASDEDNRRVVTQSWGSNFGRTTVDVFAPGIRIKSAIPRGGHDFVGGTSLAAPHVAGLAALMLSEYPALRASQIRDIMIENVRTNVQPCIANFSVARGIINANTTLHTVHTRHNGHRIATPIRTAAEFNGMLRDRPSGRFRLYANINLSGFAQWTPIPVFNGTLDGNGHTISGMNISRVGTNLASDINLGLFAILNGNVRDLWINSSRVYVGGNHSGNGWIRAGILAGTTGINSVIHNVGILSGNQVSIHRDNSVAGGLVGESRGYIRHSTVIGMRLYGNGDIGGIAGVVWGGMIYWSRFGGQAHIWYFRANNNRSIGGIVGHLSNGRVLANEAYNFTIYRANSNGSPNIGTVVGRRTGGTVATNNEFANVSHAYWGGLFNNQRRWNHNFRTMVGSGGNG